MQFFPVEFEIFFLVIHSRFFFERTNDSAGFRIRLHFPHCFAAAVTAAAAADAGVILCFHHCLCRPFFLVVVPVFVQLLTPTIIIIVYVVRFHVEIEWE